MYLARDFHRSGLCYCNHGNQSHAANKDLAAASCLTGSQEMALPGMRGEHGPAGSLTLPHGSSVVVGKLLDLSELQISHI